MMYLSSWCVHHHDVSIIMIHQSSRCIHHHVASITMVHPSSWCTRHHDAFIIMMHPWLWLFRNCALSPRRRHEVFSQVIMARVESKKSDLQFQSSPRLRISKIANLFKDWHEFVCISVFGFCPGDEVMQNGSGEVGWRPDQCKVNT